jgi:hypothetical protein
MYKLYNIIPVLLLLATLIIIPPPVKAGDDKKNNLTNTNDGKRKKPFLDSYDSAFDISYYMYNLHGFLPILSPITEPAVGIGAALAGVFFIPKRNRDTTHFQMPDVTGAAGGYTKNKTWFIGAGYLGFWKNDHIRYRGVFGYANVNLKFYGDGDGFLSEHPINFNIVPYIFLQQLTFRIKNSNFFIGGNYLFNYINVSLINEDDYEWFDPKDFEFTNSSFGIIAEYENFDNLFSPSKGWRIHADYEQSLEVIGSDRNFGILNFFTIWYFPINRFWNSGFRTEVNVATGDPPFYFLPFLVMRGVPVLRYQGKETLLAVFEEEFKLKYRWSVLGFGGYGRTFNKNNEDNIVGANAWNAGAGFRYLIARRLGLKMGLDVGFSKDSWTIYIIFGNAWLK